MTLTIAVMAKNWMVINMTTDEAITILRTTVEENLFNGKPATDTQKRLYEAMLMGEVALKGEQWIPITERLPDEFGWYIITHKDWDNSDIAFWEKHWLNGQGTVVKDVIAYRPLPEPYKENNKCGLW